MSALDTRPLPAAPAPAAPAPVGPVRRPLSSLLLVIVGVVVGLVGAGLTGRLDLLPDLSNPFASETVDRSATPLLLALDDLAEYHAATGTVQVVVDIERDTPWVPSFVSGERTTFLAVGTVDATVDFTDVGPAAVALADDGRSATITLPAPELGEVRLDTDESRVLRHDRGVIERVGDAIADDDADLATLYAAAEAKLAAAVPASDLVQRAETNTRAMLTTLARSLGVEQVTVVFADA